MAGRLIPDRRTGPAVTVFDAINRLDGVKMLLLAAVALAAFALLRAGHPPLPRWLAYESLALAVAIAISGVGYLLLLSGPALAAWVSLPLLLVWVTGVGVALARAEGPSGRHAVERVHDQPLAERRRQPGRRAEATRLMPGMSRPAGVS